MNKLLLLLFSLTLLYCQAIDRPPEDYTNYIQKPINITINAKTTGFAYSYVYTKVYNANNELVAFTPGTTTQFANGIGTAKLFTTVYRNKSISNGTVFASVSENGSSKILDTGSYTIYVFLSDSNSSAIPNSMWPVTMSRWAKKDLQYIKGYERTINFVSSDFKSSIATQKINLSGIRSNIYNGYILCQIQLLSMTIDVYRERSMHAKKLYLGQEITALISNTGTATLEWTSGLPDGVQYLHCQGMTSGASIGMFNLNNYYDTRQITITGADINIAMPLNNFATTDFVKSSL